MKPLTKSQCEEFNTLYKQKRQIEGQIRGLRIRMDSGEIDVLKYHEKIKVLTDRQRNVTDRLKGIKGR